MSPSHQCRVSAKKMRGREQELPILHSWASLFLSSLAITFVPKFPDSLRATNRESVLTDIHRTHFYVIYEHNNRIFVTFLPFISSNYNDLPTKNITFKYKTSTLTRLQRQFHELSKSGFFAIYVRCDWHEMENAHNIGSSTTMVRNNVRFNRFQYIIADRQRGWHETA